MPYNGCQPEFINRAKLFQPLNLSANYMYLILKKDRMSTYLREKSCYKSRIIWFFPSCPNINVFLIKPNQFRD